VRSEAFLVWLPMWGGNFSKKVPASQCTAEDSRPPKKKIKKGVQEIKNKKKGLLQWKLNFCLFVENFSSRYPYIDPWKRVAGFACVVLVTKLSSGSSLVMDPWLIHYGSLSLSTLYRLLLPGIRSFATFGVLDMHAHVSLG